MIDRGHFSLNDAKFARSSRFDKMQLDSAQLLRTRADRNAIERMSARRITLCSTQLATIFDIWDRRAPAHARMSELAL